ncbi:MAG TPA: peptidoglycan DD-metalloendopeptidase family protein [Candidatus Dormibacteraeota bacterium]|nr:peptidoglycan DD-metalloendopeptidase family protein [Candidatus Dormibacteraeota bacterium]
MKKVFPYILLTALTVALWTLSLNEISAESIGEIEEKISEYEKEQQRLKDEEGYIGNDKKDTEDKIEENKTQQDEVTQEINSIDERLSTTQTSIQEKESEITETNNQIEKLSEKIKKLKKEISKLQDRIEKRDALLKDRLISIQKNGGNVKYLEVIFGSQSFGDFISRAFAVNTIMDQDKNIMEEQQADKDSLEDKQGEVEEKREEVTEQKVALEDQKSELVTLKKQLDQQMEEKENLMAQLEEEHEELEEYKMSIEEEERVLSAQAKIIEQAKQEAVQKKGELEQLAEEKRRKEAEEKRKREAEEKQRREAEEKRKREAGLQQQQGASTAAKEEQESNSSSSSPSTSNDLNAGGSGVLSWPASGRLSSSYGYRSFNGGGIHYGIDIANSTGTPVSAAASGVVTRADYSSSYGNVIYIYHADLNLTTVYAHLNSMSVSLGDQVSHGQGIGTIGNTGNSFGAHLHFETHHGGWQQHNGVDPMQFLK